MGMKGELTAKEIVILERIAGNADLTEFEKMDSDVLVKNQADSILKKRVAGLGTMYFAYGRVDSKWRGMWACAGLSQIIDMKPEADLADLKANLKLSALGFLIGLDDFNLLDEGFSGAN